MNGLSLLTTLNAHYKLYLQALAETAKTVTFIPTVVGALFHGSKAVILIADVFFVWVAPDSYVTNLLNWMVDLIDPPETTIYPALKNSTDLSLLIGYNEENGEFQQYNGSIGFFVSGKDVYSGYFDPTLVDNDVIYELICVGDDGITIPYHHTVGIYNNSIPAISAGSMDANTKIGDAIVASENDGTLLIQWDRKLDIQQVIMNVTLQPGKIDFEIQAFITAKVAPESSSAILFIDGEEQDSVTSDNGIINFNITINNDGEDHLFLIEANAPSLLGDYHSFTYSCDLLDPPSGLEAKPIDGTVLISWEEVDNATGYVIFRKQGDTGEYEEIGETQSTTFSDNTGISRTNYTFVVVSTTTNGMSNYSSDVSVTPVDEPTDIDWWFIVLIILIISIFIVVAVSLKR